MQRLRSLGSRWSLGALGLFAYALLATYFLRPIWRMGGNHIAPGPGDPILNLYFLKWGIHQFGLGLPDVWDANFFFPMKGTLTLSDHLLGPAFELFLLRPLLPNAIAGYNLLLWSSFVLTAASTAWVLRQAGSSRAGAFLGGALFAFCPYRWSQMWHLQVLLMQWLPLTLWNFDRLLVERTPRRAAWFLLFYLLHITGGAYLAYMIHVPLAALFLVRMAREKRTELLSRRSLTLFSATALVGMLGLGAIFLPYVRFSRAHKLERNVADIGMFGGAFASYLSPAPGASYFPGGLKYRVRHASPTVERVLTRAENSLFPGFLAVGFGLAALWAARGRRVAGVIPWWRRRKGAAVAAASLSAVALGSLAWGDLLTLRGPGRGPLPAEEVWWTVGMLAAIGLFGAVWLRRRAGAPPLLDPARLPAESSSWWSGLALGGALSFLLSLPAFYVPAMRLLPGLSGMRVSARFGLFVAFALAAFAALGIDRASAWIAGRARTPRGRLLLVTACGTALSVFAIWELAPRPMRWMRVLQESEFPPVYGWLGTRPEVVAIAEVPMFSNPSETSYMYYSTLHWKPIANGFSGYDPPLHQELAVRLRAAPGRADLERLRQLGITHLVFHTRNRKLHLSAADLLAWSDRMGGEVERVFSSLGDEVYAIRPPRDRTPNLAGW